MRIALLGLILIYPLLGQNAVVSDGLLADYWMTNCDGTAATGNTVPDCSGNGNDATFPSGGVPVFTAKGLNWPAPTAMSGVSVPTGVLENFQTVQIYADGGIPVQYNNLAQANVLVSYGALPVIWTFTQSLTSPGYFICCGLFSSMQGSPTTQTVDPAVGPNLFTFVGATGTGMDQFYIGPTEAANYYQQSATLAPLGTGRDGQPLLLGASTGAEQMNGTIYRALFYNRPLTASEVAANDAAIKDQMESRGVYRDVYEPVSSQNNLICIGDSITEGYEVARSACSAELLTTSVAFQLFDLGLGGEAVKFMHEAEAKYATGINPQGDFNIAWIWGGTNDLCAYGEAPEDVLTYMEELAFYMHEHGARVVVFPMMSRGGYAPSGQSCDTLHDEFNSLLVANYPEFADSFVWGLYNDPNLMADGAYANAEYFVDEVHPTQAADEIVAGYASQAIDEITGLNVTESPSRDRIRLPRLESTH